MTPMFVTDFVFVILSLFPVLTFGTTEMMLKPCSQLLMGQYWCEEPEISPITQLPETCEKDNSITVVCEVANEINCIGLDNGTRKFLKRIPNGCAYSAGTEYSTALLLSVFFGWLGIDRIYLGYYAIGFLKMFSFGCFTLLYLLDIVLIALQLLGPADGSAYRINFYGPKAIPIRFSNDTYVSPYTCFDCPP
ncbi:TM2 domain-containing protein [Loa loa]|uniref:TM2 domain-containing protein n=1 Tax=Loa loa TaxID=7209 RepID=A0A1S0TNF1_LOALO|nr:TM2 domain-containing protein [Loa loa]EFO17288.1 TM2 domain-containing protein [Loa loa]